MLRPGYSLFIREKSCPSSLKVFCVDLIAPFNIADSHAVADDLTIADAPALCETEVRAEHHALEADAAQRADSRTEENGLRAQAEAESR